MGAWSILGVAHYQLQEWQEAVASLTQAENLGSLNDYFLPIALWRLGKKDEARAAFDRRIQYEKTHGVPRARVEHFEIRKEAMRLFGDEPPRTDPNKGP